MSTVIVYVLWVLSVFVMAVLNFKILHDWKQTINKWKESNERWDALCASALNLAYEINKGSKPATKDEK